MTRIARIIAVTSQSLMLAMTTLAGPVAAQSKLFEVEDGQSTKLLQVGDDAGFVIRGSVGVGTIPAEGTGARLMWYPGKAALRAGAVPGGGSSTVWDDANIGQYSVAFGIATTASATYSTALGAGSRAVGTYAMAMGSASLASGLVSTAMGSVTEATGDLSTAMGQNTKAIGGVSTAMGAFTTASGPKATAMGDRSTASGEASVAMGVGTLASGAYSLAVGFGTKATAERTVAMGDNTTASATWASALGDHTTAAGLASVAMGSYVTAGDGSFIFGDRSSAQVQTAGINQFLVRAHGGIGFNSGPNIGCDLAPNSGAWACTSSRLAKEGFEDLDGEAVLSKLAALRIQRWNYIGNGAAHVGPFAEDFWAAFGLGEGTTTITTVDADGIALLGVQTLERRTADLRAELASLRAELAAIHDEVAAMAAGARGPLPGSDSSRMFESGITPIR